MNRNLLKRIFNILKILGPGFIVMIADMDAGSTATAIQSGAQYEYKLILLQVILIPLLYIIQEISLRLGCVTGKGHGALIREYYGKKWAIFTTVTLLAVVFSALLTEFAGVASSGEIFNIPKIYSILISVFILIWVVLRGKYRMVENIALFFSFAGFILIPAAILAHPHYVNIVKNIISSQPLNEKRYLLLIAANIGAVIMPWMIYYQQSATVDKGLSCNNLRLARMDTLIGSFATQFLMIVGVILGASTLFRYHMPFKSFYIFAQAIKPIIGQYGILLFAIGLYALSMLAAFVVSVSFAWASGETWGFSHSLNTKFNQGKKFYSIYISVIVLSAIIILIPHIPLVNLMVDVEAFNGFVLPIVLGFLIVLASNKKILKEYSYSKRRLFLVYFLSLAIIVLGIFTSLPVH
jgi:NRAMP (natural resistance-associated macrophage protein)-like metal ion transporter